MIWNSNHFHCTIELDQHPFLASTCTVVTYALEIMLAGSLKSNESKFCLQLQCQLQTRM